MDERLDKAVFYVGANSPFIDMTFGEFYKKCCKEESIFVTRYADIKQNLITLSPGGFFIRLTPYSSIEDCMKIKEGFFIELEGKKKNIERIVFASTQPIHKTN